VEPDGTAPQTKNKLCGAWAARALFEHNHFAF
jgi:hypothetical protein